MMEKNKIVLFAALLSFVCLNKSAAQYATTNTPPMGWMTWNYFDVKLHEDSLKQMADAMVSSGMATAGYEYIFIDDGWQGGRDNRNNIIPDPKKFPSGIKTLADYVHSKGLKLGIYSNAAQLTCAGYTASVNFENQDAKTFAAWGVDYLKYDYCGAPEDSDAAKILYKKMADALTKSGRRIILSVCEWGNREPWRWAAQSGGALWRMSADIRDKWRAKKQWKHQNDLHSAGAGILDVIDVNKNLYPYAGVGKWNDMDMLNVGLYGKKGPSGDLGGIGCTDTEYQSQMSMWCMMASPLIASCDLRNMKEVTKNILTNKNIIAINQDKLGIQAQEKYSNSSINVFVKPLADNSVAVAILNRSDNTADYNLIFNNIGLNARYEIKDMWDEKYKAKGKSWKGKILPHETKVFKLSEIK